MSSDMWCDIGINVLSSVLNIFLWFLTPIFPPVGDLVPVVCPEYGLQGHWVGGRRGHQREAQVQVKAPCWRRFKAPCCEVFYLSVHPPQDAVGGRDWASPGRHSRAGVKVPHHPDGSTWKIKRPSSIRGAAGIRTVLGFFTSHQQ